MKCYHLPRATTIDDLAITEREPPRPGPGQVLVRIRACSLNYRDLMVATGRYGGGPPPSGLVPLSDGAGTVEGVGDGVTRVRAGDRVAGTFFATWADGPPLPEHHAHALGGSVDGVLAEYRLFDQEAVVAVPPHLDFDEAATLPCAGVTAWNALFAATPLLPGQTVLTLGTGGVSVFAAQFARAAGARVIATSSSNAKLERLQALGVEPGDCINYRDTPDWEREVWRLTGRRGVDHVVEVGGAGTLPRSINATRSGGSVSLIGVLTSGQIDPTALLFRSATLRGVYVGSRAMFVAMNRLIEVNRIRPVIDRVFPFAEAKNAFRALQQADHVGKIVIRMD